MSGNRQWMYRRILPHGEFNPEFLEGLDNFIKFASGKPAYMDGDKIRCACKKCDNKCFRDTDEVEYHISRFGFVKNYHIWRFHGERSIEPSENIVENTVENTVESESESESAGNIGMDFEIGAPSTYHTMVLDVGGPQFNNEEAEEPPNPNAQQLYDMLDAADNELWSGCRRHSQLSFVVRLMSLKAEYHWPERCYDRLTELIKEGLPDGDLLPNSYYKTKKLLRGMGLPVEKIDCCPNNCMIFWRNDSELHTCRYCGTSRFKEQSESHKNRQVAVSKMYYFPLTPRLQRLYASKATAAEMRWHATSIDDEVMRHPADSLAWKHVNNIFPDFASESRNVRLGLSTDGFQPFGQLGQQYSSWPVILTPYNLPPWLCMKEQFMFLTVLIPGPRNPKEKLDVFLQPLVEELNQLWEVGVSTYDISLKQNFQMRAMLMWTISDFPAYSMLSGWSTAGRLACPHCMGNTDAFTLEKSGKQSWFDNHRKFLPQNHPYRKNKRAFRKNKMILVDPPESKSGEELLNEIERLGLVRVMEDSNGMNRILSNRASSGWKKRSIFWDLPYWKDLLIRHNLDVMHIEKNVFDNIFNTVLNVQGKTKDTTKSREELNQYCARPELKRDETTGMFPKASYTLDNREKKVLCEWVKSLKFPDGYVSNLGRCVDSSKLKLYGMKSHDCHIFMQRILPVAFRELLPQNVWKAITDLSMFFKNLTTRAVRMDDMCRLSDHIPIILCNLERIFPPSFFDSMEHLPVHLADEARLAGPVQYRWMYPFERYLKRLKNNIKNKARVEGSISNAYLLEEVSTFGSYYFEDHVSTKIRNEPRNCGGESCSGINEDPDAPSIFKETGRPLGKMSVRYLDSSEYKAAHTYVLLNCPEVSTIYLK